MLNGVFGEMEKYLEKPGGEDGRDTILDFYFSVRHFLNMYERVDEHYRIYTELLPSGEFVIYKAVCKGGRREDDFRN